MKRIVLGAVFALSLTGFAEARKFYADAAEAMIERSGMADQSVNPTHCGKTIRFYCVYTTIDVHSYLSSDQNQLGKLVPVHIDERDGVNRYIYNVPFFFNTSKVSIIKLMTKGKTKLYLVHELQSLVPFSSELSNLLNDVDVKKW